MDHKEQHHQRHEKEREQKKKEHAAYEHRQEQSSLPFHPAWLVVVGVALVVIAILVWTLLFV